MCGFTLLIRTFQLYITCLYIFQEAMATLGMEPDEILALFRTVAGILHLGNIEVKQRPREEWATIPTTTGKEK